MWDVTGAVRTVAASMWAATTSMWTVAAFMWDLIDSEWAVATSMHGTQALCGLLHPLCGLSLEKRGNEDIAFCGGYRAFTSIPRTCPSLTTRAHVCLRFDPRRIPPTIIIGNEYREPIQGKKPGNQDREPM